MPLPPFIYETRPHDPRTIPDLTLWLDAADQQTLWDSTSGGSTPAADGAVARWTDKGPSGFSFTQGTANNRPLRRVASQGGLDGVQFDGSNDALYAQANVFDTAGLGVLCVYKLNNAANRCPLFDLNSGNSGSGSNAFVVPEANTFSTAGNRLGMYACNSSFDSSVATTTSAAVLGITATTASGTSIASTTTFRVNGSSSSLTTKAGTGNWYSQSTSDRGVMLAAYNSSGTAGVVWGAYTLYELCVWNRSLTAQELQWLDRYAASKWRIGL